jgi:hypothetical protein
VCHHRGSRRVGSGLCAATESHFTGFTQDIFYELDRTLTYTTVRGPITMCNDDGSACYDTELDMTWIGVGELLKYKIVDHQTSGGFRIVSHGQGDLRLAVAGSYLLDPDGVNLTPDESTYANIQWAIGRNVTISYGEFVDN